jgi:hypothetical protein
VSTQGSPYACPGSASRLKASVALVPRICHLRHRLLQQPGGFEGLCSGRGRTGDLARRYTSQQMIRGQLENSVEPCRLQRAWPKLSWIDFGSGEAGAGGASGPANCAATCWSLRMRKRKRGRYEGHEEAAVVRCRDVPSPSGPNALWTVEAASPSPRASDLRAPCKSLANPSLRSRARRSCGPFGRARIEHRGLARLCMTKPKGGL